MRKKKIGVLTSSRADYGIYQPLLKLLSENKNVDLHILIFGMHLMPKFGSTVTQIEKDKYGTIHEIIGLECGDSKLSIGLSYSKTLEAFTYFWNENYFDIVLALGDRFEMSAAVQSSIPFGVNIAHLHGGETTLGAIDNIYRHQITLASKFHFVSTTSFEMKVKELIKSDKDVYNVGALSLDGLSELNLPEWDSVRLEFGIPKGDFILVTFHPETIGLEKNEEYSREMYSALLSLSVEVNIVVTMPNADILGQVYRDALNNLKTIASDRVSIVESFGKQNYFSAMKSCLCLLGNTSSGILEAASFRKYVVNVGNRQKGRLQSNNVYNVDFNSKDIISATLKCMNREFNGENVYVQANTAKKIEKIITT